MKNITKLHHSQKMSNKQLFTEGAGYMRWGEEKAVLSILNIIRLTLKITGQAD